MHLRDVVALIRGKKGTKVGLTVLRQGEKTERFSVAIVRDTIDLEEQAAKLRFEEREIDGRKHLKLAVLELPSFYGGRGSGRAPVLRGDVEKLLEQARSRRRPTASCSTSRATAAGCSSTPSRSRASSCRGGVVAIEDTVAGRFRC